MKKALLTASVHNHFTSFHFPLIDLLHENSYEVHIAAKDMSANEPLERLTQRTDEFYDIDFARSPLSSKNLAAYKQLKKLIDSGEYDVIHCNTPVVGILTRLAARKARKKGTKVIYTAHGFHFYQGASKLNWLIFYPIEKVCGSLFTDCLITICDEDEARAKRLKLCKTVRRIHGVGVNAQRFTDTDEQTKNKLRKEYGYSENDVLCLCTGELNANKNQKLLINSLSYLKEVCPEFKILFAGTGESEAELKALVNQLGVENSAHLLGYRTDVDKLLKICDFVASASYREGLGVNIIEGMFSHRAAVVTHNRGHNELVAENESGFFVPWDNPQECASAFEKLYKSKELRLAMGEKAFERAQKYSSEKVKIELEEIYNDIVFKQKGK
ncbi:MAG: glycosyltransferase family 4 protein [Clostridia bacterium]|nr:glycosyltransferase family 4 protein [Clostridia bacterium]